MKHGATQINQNIDILPVFGQQVVPDLQSPVDSPQVHPIIKVDAIKYLLLFRSQVIFYTIFLQRIVYIHL